MHCLRVYRRFVVKYFGSTRVFIMWCIGTLLTIYFIDTFFLNKLRLHSLTDEVHASGDAGVPKQPVLPVLPEVVQVKVDQVKVDQVKPAAKDPVVVATQKSKEAPPKKPSVDEKKPANVVPAASDTGRSLQTPKCDMSVGCPSGEFAYFLRSGIGRDGSPVICFNGVYVMSAEKKNANRGFNVVVINNKTLSVVDTKTFDVYQDDAEMIRYLQSSIEDGHLLFMATLDEASYHLSEECKTLITLYGSTLIKAMKFRDNFVMIGQKGLSLGSALEKHMARDTGKEFGDAVEMNGCLKIPLGEVKQRIGGMQLGLEMENCGVEGDCGPSAFSVQMFTGDRNIDLPKICINGKYVMAGGLNDAGRGLNIAVVNPKSKEVIRVGHFDTFGSDSSNLEIFLEMLNDGEIIIAVSHDEASTNMNPAMADEFVKLGSSYIKKLGFRDVWVFVGQRGIVGQSPIEKLEFAGDGWPKPIDKKLCVPTLLKGNQIKPDPLATKNNKRREFCAKHDGYGDFCDASHVDDLLTPAPLSDKSLENNEVFRTPIIVVPGLNFNALRMQLETLLLNPGIQPDRVTVYYSDSTEESASLADVFGYKTHKLESSPKYSQLLLKALMHVWDTYKDAIYVIVLEEEVVPSHDFLEFLTQCLPAVKSDDSLVGISAWNVNGYDTVSTLPNLVYRTETFPGLGFLLKKSFYDAAMKDKLNDCCANRTWDGWLNGKLAEKEMVVPDVSRVYRRPYVGVTQQMELLTQLFNQPRPTNIETSIKLTNAGSLSSAQYEADINSLIKSATTLHSANAKDCLKGNGLGFYIPDSTDQVYSIYYEQQNAGDQRILSLLCKCFHLFHVKGKPVRGTHRGLLRFSYKKNMVFFIGSKTEYYRHKPTNYTPVPLSDLP